MAKRKPRREWVEDPETAKRIHWAITEARKRADSEPWAAVVLAQVAVEIALALVVNALTEHQQPALRAWIERLSVGTLSHESEVGLVNALLERSGRQIDGDAALWKSFRRHVVRRNEFLHRGKVPTAEGARASVRACERFHERLLTIGGDANQKHQMEAAARRKLAEQYAKRLALHSLASPDPEPEDDAAS